MKQQDHSPPAPAFAAALLRDDLLNAAMVGGLPGSLWLEKILDHLERRP
jgi:hypothetical protein